jgi:predicted ester cyclase
LGRKDIDACLNHLRPDFIINIAGVPHPARGHGAWRNNVETMLRAVPDLEAHVLDMFADGDKVAVRVRFKGTHQGEFLGQLGKGGPIDYLSNELYRFEHGKLAEEWICSDSLTLMTQTGVTSGRRVLMAWVSGFRLWIGLALGLAAGLVLGLAL